MVEYDKISGDGGDEFDPTAQAKSIDDNSYKLLREIRKVGHLFKAQEFENKTLVVDFNTSKGNVSAFEMAEDGLFGSSILYNGSNGIIERATIRLGKIDDSEYIDMVHAISVIEEAIKECGNPGDFMRIHQGDFDQGVLHVDVEQNVRVGQFIRFFNCIVSMARGRDDIISQ